MEARERFIESAERSLQAALAQKDIRKAVSLLRCAARYLEGAADAGESNGVRLTRGPKGSFLRVLG